jgi:ATP:cob(I)alamin adenosyltransferase
MSIYTRTGDSGESGLFGTKERFPKDSALYDALGTLDELNSLLGLCYALCEEPPTDLQASKIVRTVQEHLFIVQAELAGSTKSLSPEEVTWVEEHIELLMRTVEPPTCFLIPGATVRGAQFDVARTLARRAERATIHARSVRALGDASYAYLNRLSSLLYVLARYTAASAGKPEPAPTY